jgi:PilZ domain
VLFVLVSKDIWNRIRRTRERLPICSEHHRAPRHSFAASVELTDLQSEAHLTAHLKDISLFGCFVETATPFPEGTKLRLKIIRAGAVVSGVGRVAFSHPPSGMGIHFTSIEPASMPVLDKWVANLRQ